jgi:uncharacterized protein (TIGR00369 family)
VTAEDAGSIRSREEALAKQDLIFKDTFPGTLGVRIVETSRGHAVGELEIGPHTLHPGGYAHAGALAGFGDTVAAWATISSLDPDEDFTTIEFKSNFITGVRDGRLRAEATVVHRGRRTMVVDVKVRTVEDEPRLVSMMIVTQAVLKRADGGRS